MFWLFRTARSLVRFVKRILIALAVFFGTAILTGIVTSIVDPTADFTVGAVISLIVTIVVWVILGKRDDKARREDEEAVQEAQSLSVANMCCNREEGSITLHQRMVYHKPYLSISEICAYEYKDHAAKVVYTGATVGGVHMGGFHTENAYKTVSDVKKTGFYDVWVKENDRGLASKKFCLQKIVLANEALVREAEADPLLAPYLEGNVLVLIGLDTYMTESEQMFYEAALRSNNVNLYKTYTQEFEARQHLSKETAEAVIRFITAQ